MELKQIASNMTEITLTNGARVLFSYETPVAAYVDGDPIRTDRKWSVTTSKHIRKYLGSDFDRAEIKPQSTFALLQLMGELA